LIPIGKIDGCKITTIEGLKKEGELHPIQQAFIDEWAFQCGYCTPGMIISAWVLLKHNPNPTRDDILKGMAGNLCRCTGYEQIVEAITKVAVVMRGRNCL
jgi:aerobic-type carbon monoxide dehydrogenase small subunit (CoxS/CutS family)